MELAEFENYIQNISKDDWNRLFSYIPLIQQTEKFGEWIDCDFDKGIPFPYVIPTNVVDEFRELMYELDLVINFNWTTWKAGHKILAEANFKSLDTITLFQLLTVVIRADRFCEGRLVSEFEDGTVLKILIEIKLNVDNM